MMQLKSSDLQKMKWLHRERIGNVVSACEFWHVLVLNEVLLFAFLNVTQKFHSSALAKSGNTSPGWFLVTKFP